MKEKCILHLLIQLSFQSDEKWWFEIELNFHRGWKYVVALQRKSDVWRESTRSYLHLLHFCNILCEMNFSLRCTQFAVEALHGGSEDTESFFWPKTTYVYSVHVLSRKIMKLDQKLGMGSGMVCEKFERDRKRITNRSEKKAFPPKLGGYQTWVALPGFPKSRKRVQRMNKGLTTTVSLTFQKATLSRGRAETQNEGRES